MEKTPLKFICLFCCCMVSFSLRAQVIEDANGRPMLERQYTDVQGSPYFSEAWQKGLVKMANGKTYKDVELKYDLVSDEVFFKNAKGDMLGFVDPVLEFKLLPADDINGTALSFRNGYKPTADATSKTFYQILSDGQTPFARRISKKMMESTPYSSATIVKTFGEVSSYYIMKDGQPLKIKKDKKVLFAALGDYSAEMDEFIRSKNLKLKSDTDFIVLMNYYNSLK